MVLGPWSLVTMDEGRRDRGTERSTLGTGTDPGPSLISDKARQPAAHSGRGTPASGQPRPRWWRWSAQRRRSLVPERRSRRSARADPTTSSCRRPTNGTRSSRPLFRRRWQCRLARRRLALRSRRCRPSRSYLPRRMVFRSRSRDSMPHRSFRLYQVRQCPRQSTRSRRYPLLSTRSRRYPLLSTRCQLCPPLIRRLAELHTAASTRAFRPVPLRSHRPAERRAGWTT